MYTSWNIPFDGPQTMESDNQFVILKANDELGLG